MSLHQIDSIKQLKLANLRGLSKDDQSFKENYQKSLEYLEKISTYL